MIVTIHILPTTQQSNDVVRVAVLVLVGPYIVEGKRIRIYGQEFEAVSNPFPNADGIAIRAFSKRETEERTLQLPLPVVQMVTRQKKKKIA